MSGSGRPAAPRGAKASGRRLWQSIMAEYELEQHELELLKEMCRTVDQLDDLAAIVAADGLMVRGPGLAERVHPAVVEARQLRIALARLAAALRLPGRRRGVQRRQDGDTAAAAARRGPRGLWAAGCLVRRRAVELVDVPAVPARLRTFDPDDWPGGYWRAHGAWLAARRAWETRNGVTLAEVWDRAHQAAVATGTLDGLAAAYAPEVFIADDDPDPRLAHCPRGAG
jgi:terminase small subunit-like protein